MVKTWDVLVRVEAWLRVEAATMEEAEALAESEFDPTAYDVEVVDSCEIEVEDE